MRLILQWRKRNIPPGWICNIVVFQIYQVSRVKSILLKLLTFVKNIQI